MSEIAVNIALLNAQSSRKHYEDIMKDVHLLGNDVMFNRNPIANR